MLLVSRLSLVSSLSSVAVLLLAGCGGSSAPSAGLGGGGGSSPSDGGANDAATSPSGNAGASAPTLTGGAESPNVSVIPAANATAPGKYVTAATAPGSGPGAG